MNSDFFKTVTGIANKTAKLLILFLYISLVAYKAKLELIIFHAQLPFGTRVDKLTCDGSPQPTFDFMIIRLYDSNNSIQFYLVVL